MHATTLPTNAELAAQASEALTAAGLSANDAWQIVDLLPPRGHHEITTVLADDPGAPHWMGAIWHETFADRFYTRSHADAVQIQRILREATR